MTQQSLKNRLGTPFFNDSMTEIQCCLPEGLIIYSYTGRIWLGGSHNPMDLLYIERVSADIQGVPTILADGDIDLNLVSIGSTEELSNGAEGVVVAGYLRDQSFSGYLGLIPINDTYQYLVMMANVQLEQEARLKTICLALQKALQQAA